MKPAFLKEEAFLAEVKAALASGERRLWWLGQSGFLIVQNRRAIVLDPYLSDSLTRKYAKTDKPHTRMTELVVSAECLGRLGVIDLITSSHNHTDHFDAETLLPLLKANPQAKLVIPAANRAMTLERLGEQFGDRLIELDDGQTTETAGVRIGAVAAAHPSIERDEIGKCRFLGYYLKLDMFKIYHSGDTLLHGGLVSALKPLSVDVALLPINGDRPERRVAGNLDGKQAAQLAHEIGARLAIPCHFDLFEFNTEPPDDFVRECERLGQPYRVLRNGEGYSW